MDRWDAFFMIVAGYVAVVSLVRLMANRRNELVEKIREEIAKRRAEAEARAAAAEEEDLEQEAA
jgi:hypothetical protein